MLSRRALLRNTGVLMAGALARPLLAQAAAARPPAVSLFTKHLVGMPFGDMASALAEMGFAGIEAPVRIGGHVEPAKVEDGLPELVGALRKQGLEITMLTTDINDTGTASRSEVVLRTAAKLGIRRFRMKWYAYDSKKPLWAQLDEIRPRLRDLVAMSKEIGVLPCYQNHSGAKYVGAGIWDMAMLMRDHRPEDLAWAFDFFHATVEGGLSWPNEFALVRERLGMVYFKNFKWEGRVPEGVPLAEGVVGKPQVAALRASGFSGPVGLHIEYLKGNARDKDYLAKALDATRRDLATLRSWLA
jgi:sugar phosphate isomerase/epimerase